MSQRLGRARKRVCWRPLWCAEYAGWAHNYVKDNLWRLPRGTTFQDAMQEAALVFSYLVVSYPRVIEPAHFMALFKTALRNKFNDLALYTKRQREAEAVLDEDVSTAFVGRIGEMNNNGYLYALINEAPEEVQLALVGLAKGVAARRKIKRKPFLRKETLNTKLSRLLGIPRDLDAVGQLKQILSN